MTTTCHVSMSFLAPVQTEADTIFLPLQWSTRISPLDVVRIADIDSIDWDAVHSDNRGEQSQAAKAVVAMETQSKENCMSLTRKIFFEKPTTNGLRISVEMSTCPNTLQENSFDAFQ